MSLPAESSTSRVQNLLLKRLPLLIPPLLIYAAALAITSPVYFGDSLYYAQDVLRSRASQVSVHGLWDFGHILWRPLGALISPLALAWIPNSWAWTPLLKISFGMVVISEICGAISMVLFYDLIRRFLERPWQRILLMIAFVWANPILGYSQSGTSYIPAMMFLTLAIWFQVKREVNYRTVCLTTLALSGAVLLWFPLVLAVPAAASLGILLHADGFPRKFRDWTAALQIILCTAAVVAVAVGGAGWMAGQRSASDYIGWIGNSKHDWNQNRQWLRAFGGASHLLIEPSNGGVYLKRLIMRDPYSPVNILDLIPLTISRIGAAYVLYAAPLVSACYPAQRGHY